MRTVIYVAAAAALALAFRLGVAPSEGAEEAESKDRIPVDELGKSADLIGRLGKPLGSWVTIKGTWSYPKSRNGRRPKDASLRFTVSHVDGVELAKSVEFNIAQIDAKNSQGQSAFQEFKDRRKLDGRTWTLKAYETGRLKIDTPPEYYEAIGIASYPAQEAYWNFDKFVSEIHGVLQPE